MPRWRSWQLLAIDIGFNLNYRRLGPLGAKRVRPLVVGITTYVRGTPALHSHLTRAPGTESARYCYIVWLRHLTMAYQSGLCARTDS